MAQVTCSRCVYSKRGDKVDCTPHEAILRRNDIWRHWRLKWLKGYILLIFSIGMPYHQGGYNTNLWQVSSAQTKRTQVLTWEKTLSTAPALVDLGACSLLGWIALETSFPKKSKITVNGVRSKKLWHFSWGDLCCFRELWQCREFLRRAAPRQCHASSAAVPHLTYHSG
jgi:hypothetical protein